MRRWFAMIGTLATLLGGGGEVRAEKKNLAAYDAEIDTEAVLLLLFSHEHRVLQDHYGQAEYMAKSAVRIKDGDTLRLRSLWTWLEGAIDHVQSDDFDGVLRGIVGARDVARSVKVEALSADSAAEFELNQAVFDFMLRDFDSAEKRLTSTRAKDPFNGGDAGAVLLSQVQFMRNDFAAAAASLGAVSKDAKYARFARLRRVECLLRSGKIGAAEALLKAPDVEERLHWPLVDLAGYSRAIRAEIAERRNP